MRCQVASTVRSAALRSRVLSLAKSCSIGIKIATVGRQEEQLLAPAVRRHQADGVAIANIAATFGVSRPTYYKAQNALQSAGLAGLLPGKRGPKGGHKVSDEVIAFVAELKTKNPALTTSQCLHAIEEHFGVKVHRRSLERALAHKKTNHSTLIGVGSDVVSIYERLRAAVLNTEPISGFGLHILRRCGLAAWLRQGESEPYPATASSDHGSISSTTRKLSPATNDLTRLLAGIIVDLAMEPAHAHG